MDSRQATFTNTPSHEYVRASKDSITKPRVRDLEILSSNATSSHTNDDHEESLIPIFFTIPDENHKYQQYLYLFAISHELYSRIKVKHLLHASIQILNQNVASSQGVEYEIMCPDLQMISDSFCDIAYCIDTIRMLTFFNKKDVTTKGLHLYCDIADDSRRLSVRFGSDSIKKLIPKHRQHAVERALKESGNDLVEAARILAQDYVMIPLFIKIPNRINKNDEYEIHDQCFEIARGQMVDVQVDDVMNAAQLLLNREFNASGRAKYVLFNPTQDMISNSFCDYTFVDEQLKYLIQFNKNDLITKGLHLFFSGDVYQQNIQNVMALGYNQTAAEEFLQLSNNNIDAVLAALHQVPTALLNSALSQNVQKRECKHDITKCQSIQILSEQYNGLKRKAFHDTKLLNAFHHIITYHGRNHDEFDYIFKEFGGQTCELENCDIIREYYEVDGLNEASFAQNLCNQIHCYVHHGYDTFRFTKDERKQIRNIMDDEKQTKSKTEEMFIILKRKKNRFKSLIAAKRFMNDTNKFSSNMGQIMDEQQHEEKQQTLPSYSFSYRFNYLERCKHSLQRSIDGFVKDFYVPPKHHSLKEELLNNNISRISLKTWEAAEAHAEIHTSTDRYKKIKATFGNKSHTYLRQRDDDTVHFGYNEGDCMELKHLMSVILYCALTEFQQKYSETYRKKCDKDTFETIKKRHSNFHHFAKALKETVEVFGTFYTRAPHAVKFYHGVNAEMIFYGTSSHIYSVLSTTIKRSVALHYAEENGVILTMVPYGMSKYFDVRWLSKYPEEQEFLFIGGRQTMHFTDILQTSIHISLKTYITALRIIERMLDGRYFEEDLSICIKLIKFKVIEFQSIGNGQLSEMGNYPDISDEIKYLTRSLMEHEANKYQPHKYNTNPNLYPYIDKLLHNICSNKTAIEINIKSMNVALLSKYDFDGCGYIGYSFLKDYICPNNISDGYESVDLSFINMILPSLQSIHITHLSSIHSSFLNEIFNLLTLNEAIGVNYIELRLEQELGFGNIVKQCAAYHSQFEHIGFICVFDSESQANDAKYKRLYFRRKKT